MTTKIKFAPKYSHNNYFRIEHSVDNNRTKSREFFEMVLAETFGKVRSASLFCHQFKLNSTFLAFLHSKLVK